MGYRKYAKDYEIEYVERPEKKRPKAVRIYVGPYFRFTAAPERIRWLRWFYLIGIAAMALLLLIPMCVDSPFARTWYIQTPMVAAWIPWYLAACSVWRLWTAGEQVEREHCDLIHDRMSGSCLFLMGLTVIGVVGCLMRLYQASPLPADLVICGCCLAAGACGVILFSRRKELEMVQVENPAAKKTKD